MAADKGDKEDGSTSITIFVKVEIPIHKITFEKFRGSCS
jgi:hypothetical protein